MGATAIRSGILSLGLVQCQRAGWCRAARYEGTVLAMVEWCGSTDSVLLEPRSARLELLVRELATSIREP